MKKTVAVVFVLLGCLMLTESSYSACIPASETAVIRIKVGNGTFSYADKDGDPVPCIYRNKDIEIIVEFIGTSGHGDYVVMRDFKAVFHVDPGGKGLGNWVYDFNDPGSLQIIEISTGNPLGTGPAYYFEKAMGQKWFAWIFAIATILACGVFLPGVQSNSIGNAVEATFGSGDMIETAMGTLSFAKILTGTIVVLILGFIIFGGVKRIANFTQIVVPFMALAYIIIAAVIVLLNIDMLPDIIGMILGDAFTPMAGMGAAIGWGVKRGVYSNEAGQGTGPHAAAAASVEHPAQQGLVQAFSVYIDTLFVCSATAFMILITGAYNVHGVGDTFLVQNLGADIAANGPLFTQQAIEKVLPGLGNPFVAFALFFFSFTTILAYYYIAETNIAYIQRTFKIPGMIGALKLVLMAATFYGAVKTANLAWGLGDIGVGLMAWLNIAGILIIFFMSKPALKALKDYEEQHKAGVESYTFNPLKLGIKNATFWEKRYNKQTATTKKETDTETEKEAEMV